MARRSKEEAEQTRCAIIDAAIRVFSVKGVSDASLSMIAREAGVTRGAVYWHFSNKTDLLNTLWDEILLPFEALTVAGTNKDEPEPLGKLRELLVFLLEGVTEDPRRQNLFRIVMDKCEAADDTGTIHLRHYTRHVEGLKIVETILTYAVKRGQLPGGLPIRLAASVIVAYIDGLIANWLNFPDLFDIKGKIPLLVQAGLDMLPGLSRTAGSPGPG